MTEARDCRDDRCATCADEATPALVVEVRPGDLALVDTGRERIEVSILLVDAVVGDRVLVHAGEAIGTVSD